MDRRRTYISSVMTAKKSEASPNKRRKYDEAYKARTRALGIRPKWLYRWQQAQIVAEVGSVGVARDPEVRALRARLKRAEQELDI